MAREWYTAGTAAYPAACTVDGRRADAEPRAGRTVHVDPPVLDRLGFAERSAPTDRLVLVTGRGYVAARTATGATCGASNPEATKRSAAATFVAIGTLCTLQTRRTVWISGSWG